MGFYIRKSMKVGPFRFNLSKSGVGVSAGVKGFRLGKGPRGNYIHAGMKGFYYQKTINNSKNKLPDNNNNTNDKPVVENPITEYDFKEIESGNVAFMVDNDFNDILTELNKKSKIISFVPIAIIISVALAYFIDSILIYSAAILIPIAVLINKRLKTTYIIYDIDDDKETELQGFYDVLNNLNNSKKLWHITSAAKLTSMHDRKRNSGASNLIKREPISIKYKIPKYVKTNIKVPSIPVGKQILYFFPERLLIKDGKKFGTVNYSDLKIDYDNSNFIETEKIPKDAEIIGYRWLYVNKNGMPDKRFKDNKQIPLLNYSEILFKSDTGLNEMIMASKPNIGKEISDVIKMLAEQK
ncbi:DUF4236 domain-containing protein [Treponema ruminis]|uniref:DUF4236 domain-containing protein n=1 Tax=Treponema ruminis TaxID=744515 RepID=A0A7W8LMW0_9SPIR|nr:DUF4236 domain-containing protein [Treponema ruminis]MBB5226728.1 hypothetical protein [Treponema ruminis]QSI02049.1 DUF4236 domain-containing protein [Treponema ruminis]